MSGDLIVIIYQGVVLGEYDPEQETAEECVRRVVQAARDELRQAREALDLALDEPDSDDE